MGRLALLVLVLIALYLTVIEPYLTTRRILFGFEGLSVGLSPPTLKLKRAYLYMPTPGSYRFFGISGLEVAYTDKVRIRLEEGILVNLRAEDREGRRPPPFPVPDLLRNADIRVDNLFITSVGRGHLWVNVRNLTLRDRILKGEAFILVNGKPVHAKVREAVVLSRGVLIGDAEVVSDRFRLRIDGFLSERGDGRFRVNGYVGPVDRKTFLVSRIRVDGEGKLSYTELTADVNLSADRLTLKGRRDFKDLRAKARISLRFGRDLTLRGIIWGEDLSAVFKVSWMPRRYVDLKIQRFELEEKLLRVSTPIRTVLRGDLFLDLDEKRVLADLTSGEVLYESRKFGRGYLSLDYRYGEKKGKIYLGLEGPGSLRLEGTVEGRTFSGTATLYGLPVRRGNLKAIISYRGGFTYREGRVNLAGSGSFRDLMWRDIYIGNGSYRVVLTEGRVSVTFRGSGFEGVVRGSVEGKILADAVLRDFSLNHKGVKVLVQRGRVEVIREGKSTVVGVRLFSGSIKSGELSSHISGVASLILEGKRSAGEFRFDLSDLELFGERFTRGRVQGNLQGTKALGTFEVEGLGKGRFRTDLIPFRLRAEGGLVYRDLSGKMTLNIESGEMSFRLTGSYRSVPVDLEGSLRGGELVLKVGSIRRKIGVAGLTFRGLTVRGETLEFLGAEIDLFGEDLVVLPRSEGFLSVKDRSMFLEVPYGGGFEGAFRIQLSGDKLDLSSKGRADLAKISFLTATYLGGRVEGELSYRFRVKGKSLEAHVETERGAILYSKYLSVPVNVDLTLEAEGRSMAAFLSLWSEGRGLTANLGTDDLRNYYLYILSKDLPVRYRTGGADLKLSLSGSGWVKVKDLREADLHMDIKLSGTVRIVKERARTSKKKLPPVRVRVNFRSEKPLRIELPEGYIYAQVRGQASGTLAEPTYRIEALIVSGELRYFGKNFYVRGGKVKILRTAEGLRRYIEMDLVHPGEDMNIHISFKGDPSDPQVVLWSEPPKSVGEIVAHLIGGTGGEGAIPVPGAVLKKVGSRSLGGDILSALGVEINILTKTSSQGDLGVSLNIRKRISRFLSVEYQQSTLRDPRETFYGGGLRLPGSLSLFGRVFSDDSSEVKLRFIRKFDF